MSKELIGRGDFEIAIVRLGVKLDFVVPMVNTAELIYVLSGAGYKLSQNPNNPEHFVGTKEKENVEFYIDGSRRVFGASSITIDHTLATINEIFSLTKKHLGYEMKDYVSFFEVEINGVYGIQKDVYRAISKLYQDSKDMLKINELLGFKSAQIALKIGPYNENINSKVLPTCSRLDSFVETVNWQRSLK